ncbi:MAG TPA: hypothetical protein VGN34_05425 [Ktedonobacteraceae bacterium]
MQSNQVSPSQYSSRPKKKFSTGCLIGIGVAVGLSLFLCICTVSVSLLRARSQASASDLSGSNQNVMIATTPSYSDSSSQWVVTHTFQGNGDANTVAFTVNAPWKLQWSCGAGTYSENVIISVYNADGTVRDYAAINTICNIGNTGGGTTEYQGGTVYLHVASEGGWTVKVLEE